MKLRKRMNLDQVSLDTMSVLAMGDYNVGKTHLLGDCLRWAVERGKSAHFINLAGQDGYSVMAGMGLGDRGETVETVDDFEAALVDVKKAGVWALGVDGLQDLMEFVVRDECGGELRYPDPKKDGERAKMLWGQIKTRTKNLVMLAKTAAPYVFFTSPIDKGDNMTTGAQGVVAPDLIGKMAFASSGWFDYVILLTAQVMGPGKIQRMLDVSPSAGVRTRQRCPKVITGKVTIPEGKGGWGAFYARVEEAMGVTEVGK